MDRYDRAIPDEEYHTKDFDRIIALRARTEAIARHLAEFMGRTDRFAKTIVFCVDQEHADEMRRALDNFNADLARKHLDYIARVTSEEGKVGKGHLSRFQELETTSPVILTASQLLTTGVDAPTCKNVVLARVVNSMTEFKQIIGAAPACAKTTARPGSTSSTTPAPPPATSPIPTSTVSPEIKEETIIDAEGQEIGPAADDIQEPPPLAYERKNEDEGKDKGGGIIGDPPASGEPRKFYVDGGRIEIAAHLVYELDTAGNQLRVVQFTDYAGEKVRTLFTSADELQDCWADPLKREEVMLELEECGIACRELSEATGRPDADPLDLLCHLAFDTPLRTRKERVDYLRKNQPDFFDQYGPEARGILTALFDKYTDFGPSQFGIPDALQVPPIFEHGNLMEIAGLFGGASRMKQAVDQLQVLLYGN